MPPEGTLHGMFTEVADHGIVARLNNAAVGFLAINREDLASDLFRFALEFAVGRLGLAEATQVVQQASSWHQQERTRKGNGVCARDPQAQLSSMSLQQQDASPEMPYFTSLPFVHAEGILLMPTSTAFSTDVLLSSTITSSIVVFNMALANHLQALHGRSVNLKQLAVARTLYLKSFLLLKDVGILKETSTGGVHPMVDLLVMALCNNLAQTNYEIGDDAEARLYFGHLAQYASTVDNSAQYADDAMAATMVHHYKSSFLLNATILHPPLVAPAA